MNARPSNIVVDDEPTTLASLPDVLTRRYSGDYRAIPQLSALGALSELERLTIAERERGFRETRPASALFVLIGAQPHTERPADAVQRDAKGLIVTGTDVNTDAADWPPEQFPTRFDMRSAGYASAVRPAVYRQRSKTLGGA